MAKKEYPIRLDMEEIKKRTTERDAAARRRRAAARRERELGSMEDILGRAERNQAREAEEARLMGVGRKAKGGKVKKMACGGKTHKMAKGGKVNHKGCGIAKRGLTKGRMV